MQSRAATRASIPEAAVCKPLSRCRTGLVADPIYAEHLTGLGHPECPERTGAVLAALREAKLNLQTLIPRAATEAELELCHTKSYLATVRTDVAAGASSLSTGDTAVCGRSRDVALRAAGGVLASIDAVINGEVASAFCLVRPPGHHATPDRGMGFCLYNNIAIGARYAQKRHGIGKVLIVDWDVHHGNGTQDIFYSDGSVMVFNTHQSPWYPGTGSRDETGTGRGLGCIMNCPFPAGAGRREIMGAFEERLAPAAEKFKPELILISAGFDSRMGDPLGNFTLADSDFADLTRLVMELAKRYAGGKLVSVLEGGYHLGGLGQAAVAHVGAMEQTGP